MLHRSFVDPGWLWLGLLLIPLMGFGWRTFAGLGSTRRWLALGLRSAVVITAVLLLAGPRWSDTASDLTVVAVVDRSESVRRFAERGLEGRGSVGPNRSIEAWAGAWVDEASDDRRPEDRVGWVGFDGEAWIDRLPAASWVFDDALAVESALSPVTGSDLAAAIELGLASHVGDGGLRLMLVSDGNDTSGRAIEAARLAAAAGVPIDVAPLRYRVGDDVRVDGVYAPRRIGLGQTGQVRVVLRAARPSAGRLLLRQDGRWLTGGVAVTPDDWTEDQDGGVVLLRSLDVAFDDERPTRFEAVFEPEDAESTDAVATNNAAEAITLVDGPGKVLLVDGEGGAAGGVLAQALRRRGAQVDRVATSAIPSRLSELLGYRAVIFQNVPYAAISRTAEQALVDYVHDFGGGFAMVGGPQSFGAGGWTYSLTDAALLPVTCEIPAQTLLPSGALVLVIDRSGSMSAPVGQSGQSQQEVAGEAAILAMQTLFPQDLAGVVAFESEAQWVVPLGPNNVERSAEQVRSIRPGGGTNIAPGLALAYRALASSAVEDQALRHVLLLTDGGAPSDGLIEAAQTYADQGISLSVVGVGASGTQRFLLEDLAKAGGGVYYDVADPTRLPQIFIKEALTIRRNLVREAEFVPVRGPIASPVTAGLTAAPPLQGLVITGQRNDGLTFTPLLGPEGEPLFAHRQVGLGRSAAFTSDATARWAGDWLVWEGFADFWKRTVDLVARPPEVRTHEFAMTPAAQGQSLELRLEVFDEPGMAPVRRVLGAVAAPQGGSTTVALERTGPSTFVGSINAEDRGAYLAMLRIERVDGRAESISTTASVRDSAELAAPRDNLPLLQQIAEITGGRVLDVSAPAAGALFAGDRSFESRRPKAVRWQLAPWLLALLLLDVANRRVAWRPESWSAVARAALGALGGSGVRREPVIATAGWSGPRAATATAGVAEQARETARRRDAARRPDRKAVSSVVDDSAQVSRRSSLDKPGAGAQSPSPSPSTATDAANASEAAPESGMQRLLEARRRARERMDGDDSAESR